MIGVLWSVEIQCYMHMRMAASIGWQKCREKKITLKHLRTQLVSYIPVHMTLSNEMGL